MTFPRNLLGGARAGHKDELEHPPDPVAAVPALGTRRDNAQAGTMQLGGKGLRRRFFRKTRSERGAGQ
ncbi:MAG: hypothetical protein WCR07_11095, partial [Verrucomicrobiota bacterium]